jgi:N-methylhydantoinase B
VRAILPEASVVDPRPPAAVNGRAVTVRRLVDALLGALAPALPGRLPAASNGHPLVMYGGGVDPATARAYGFAEFATGGMGARPEKDGVETIQTDTSNAQNIPVEALELETPVRVGYLRLRPDSGGPGRHRGGLGFEKRLEVLRGALRVSHRGERHYTAPWGVFGGQAGASARSLLRRADGSESRVPSKLDFTLEPGDRLDVWTTGGGGYGDPLTRDPGAVLEDVLDGKVSVEAAAERYGIVIGDGGVDEAASRELRDRLAAERGPVAWTYDRGPLGRQ